MTIIVVVIRPDSIDPELSIWRRTLAARRMSLRTALPSQHRPFSRRRIVSIAPSIRGSESTENMVIEREQGTIVLDFDAKGRPLGV